MDHENCNCIRQLELMLLGFAMTGTLLGLVANYLGLISKIPLPEGVLGVLSAAFWGGIVGLLAGIITILLLALTFGSYDSPY